MTRTEVMRSAPSIDLVYDARDVDEELASQDKIDAWFDAKTKGLNEWQKDELRKSTNKKARPTA
jgi:type I restriction enzyme, R subunit